jgi:hypothetical protein
MMTTEVYRYRESSKAAQGRKKLCWPKKQDHMSAVKGKMDLKWSSADGGGYCSMETWEE